MASKTIRIIATNKYLIQFNLSCMFYFHLHMHDQTRNLFLYLYKYHVSPNTMSIIEKCIKAQYQGRYK